MFNKEVGHMVLMGVIENSNYSECVAPYFSQPKPKTNRVYLLSD